MKFNWNIIGHGQQLQYLQKQIVSGRINHAYLFIGRKNLDLIKIVTQFIKAVVCTNNEIKPCGKCSNCRDVNKKKYSDLIYVSPLKNNISVSQIRQLKLSLSKKPWFEKWQIAIIEEANTLNIQAANALLKILEEPAKMQILILIVDDMNYLPKTILSRCQKIQFLPVPIKVILKYLQDNDYQKEDYQLLTKIFAGYPEKIIKELKKENSEKKYLNTYSTLTALLLMPNITKKINLLDKKISADQIKEYIHCLQNIFQDIIFVKINLLNMVTNNNVLPQLTELTKKYSFPDINSINKKLKFINDNLYRANSKILLENLIINYLK